jgi:Protein of unknown function (DUF998)
VSILKGATVVGCSAFAMIFVGLHFLRRDLSPLRRGMSRYAGGDTLVLATVGFIALAGGLLSLSAFLSPVPRHASAWLIAAAAGLVAVALTPIGDSPTSRAKAGHVVGAFGFYLGSTLAMFRAASDSVDQWLVTSLFACLSLFLIGGSGVVGFRSLVGLFQRLVFLLVVSWAVRAVLR